MTCRICSANDRDALVEQMAEKLWGSYKEDDRPWDRAGPYWQTVFRQLAATAISVARS